MSSRAAMLRFLLAFCLVFGVAEGAARVVERRSDVVPLTWYDEATALKVDQMAERGPTETVVVGTSMAWQGLLPEVLDGDDAYNAGLAGGVPTVTERWLTEEVIQSLRPRRVIWGFSPFDFSDRYGDAGLDIYSQAPASRSGVLAEADRQLREVSALFRQRSLLRNPSLILGAERDDAGARLERAKRILGPAGERRDFEKVLTADRALEVQSRITPFVPDRDDLAAVARAVHVLRDEGIEVVFVELPVPPRFLELYPRGPSQHAEIFDLLEAMAVELDVSLISITGDYTDNDFVDFTHLNQAAAQRFSEETAASLDSR